MEYYHVNIVHPSKIHTNVLSQIYFGWKQEQKLLELLLKWIRQL
jgi:hypothetical protein